MHINRHANFIGDLRVAYLYTLLKVPVKQTTGRFDFCLLKEREKKIQRKLLHETESIHYIHSTSNIYTPKKYIEVLLHVYIYTEGPSQIGQGKFSVFFFVCVICVYISIYTAANTLASSCHIWQDVMMGSFLF